MGGKNDTGLLSWRVTAIHELDPHPELGARHLTGSVRFRSPPVASVDVLFTR